MIVIEMDLWTKADWSESIRLILDLEKKKAIGNKHTLSTDMAERIGQKYNLTAAGNYLAIMNISSAWEWDNTEESIVQR